MYMDFFQLDVRMGEGIGGGDEVGVGIGKRDGMEIG